MSSGLVIITGASSGIGAACAEAFSKKGHSLLLLARRVEKCEALKLPNSLCLKCDITDSEALEKCIEEGVAKFGPVNCLINNAGCMLLGNMLTQDPIEWKFAGISISFFIVGLRMMDLNVTAMLVACQIVAKKMKEQKSGFIINIGSIAGVKTFPNHGVYCAAKYAVRALTETLREELSQDNVRVCHVAPGVVETELLSHTTSTEIKEGYGKWKVDGLGGEVLLPVDIADTCTFVHGLPPRANVREILIHPTKQTA